MFPFSPFARAFAGFGLIACAACVNVAPKAAGAAEPFAFYTVTGEIALSRHEPRVAAVQYSLAAQSSADTALLARAADVTALALQPSLTLEVASRWSKLDPASVEAHRAAASAALELFKIEESSAHYRVVLDVSPRGTDAEFATLDRELAASDNVHGARQLADRLAGFFPDSPAALKLQAETALRADDPAAAMRSFAALAALGTVPDADYIMSLWRAQILSGNRDAPLAESQERMERSPTAENRLDHSLLLLAAQQNAAARAQLQTLTEDPTAAPAAQHLLGLVDFEEGRLDEAGAHFAELVVTGKFLDDAIYYLGLIAERHQDLERALRLYAQVQEGDNAVPALLRAATILRAHGAAPAAEDLLDRLVEEVPARAPEILAARSRLYADAGEPAHAATVLNAAMRQYPDSVELQYAAASLDDDRGRVAAALHALKAVARRRPDDPTALNAYGYTLADHNRQLRLARSLIERAHACAPKNAAILDSFGWVLFRQGKGEDALTYLEAAYAGDHGGDIAAHLGEVLWHLGRRSDADRVWSEGSRAEADNHLLKATLVRLHASN